jgi:hypothetical protein
MPKMSVRTVARDVPEAEGLLRHDSPYWDVWASIDSEEPATAEAAGGPP